MAVFRSAKAYRVMSYVTSLLYLYLFVSLLSDPHAFLRGVGIEGAESAYFLARRASMLMLGFAVASFFARNAPCSDARQAITLSIAVSMAGLCGMSSFEYVRGFANSGILTPAIIESILALVYFAFWLSNRHPEVARNKLAAS